MELLQTISSFLAGNRYLMAMLTLTSSMGTNFLLQEFGPVVSVLMHTRESKYIVLFVICFLTNRDLLTSFIVAMTLYLCFVVLFNKDSSFYLLSNPPSES